LTRRITLLRSRVSKANAIERASAEELLGATQELAVAQFGSPGAQVSFRGKDEQIISGFIDRFEESGAGENKICVVKVAGRFASYEEFLSSPDRLVCL